MYVTLQSSKYFEH